MFYGCPENCRIVYPAEYFKETMQGQFEDDLFSIPKQYDAYLSYRYGNYMVLPPLEEQGVKLDHLVKIDTENCYLKYKGVYYCKK